MFANLVTGGDVNKVDLKLDVRNICCYFGGGFEDKVLLSICYIFRTSLTFREKKIDGNKRREDIAIWASE